MFLCRRDTFARVVGVKFDRSLEQLPRTSVDNGVARTKPEAAIRRVQLAACGEVCFYLVLAPVLDCYLMPACELIAENIIHRRQNLVRGAQLDCLGNSITLQFWRNFVLSVFRIFVLYGDVPCVLKLPHTDEFHAGFKILLNDGVFRQYSPGWLAVCAGYLPALERMCTGYINGTTQRNLFVLCLLLRSGRR